MSPPPPLPAAAAAVRILPWVKSTPARSSRQATTSPPPGQPAQPEHPRSRRTILPYGGAKSDGLISNQHAFISCHVIAAAERKKRESYSRSSTAELPLEKVNNHN